MSAACSLETRLLSRWRLPKRIGGNAWAETYRELGPDENRHNPGKWVSVAWQRELLDAMADPHVDWLVIMKASQVGVSELVRNAIGRWATRDPGDVLWVMANENAARKAMKKLHKLFANTPALRGLVSPRSRDSTLLEMVLTNGMRIVIGWAGSPQSLASDPFRYVVLDEVALYDWSSQGEGSPVELARDRTKIWGSQAKVILLSKPKDSGDIITKQFMQTVDKRAWAVPCPHCDALQVLAWDAIRWRGGSPANAPTDPQLRSDLAERLLATGDVWYECVSCAGEIRNVAQAIDDPRSSWIRYDSDDAADTVTRRRRAYHVTEIYHWSQSPATLAGRWLNCNTPSERQVFWTASLGVAYTVTRSALAKSIFAARAIHARGVVPSWAVAVLATADTQKDGWWVSLRSWGHGRRSRTLDWGWVTTLADLRAFALQRRFPVGGTSHSVRAQSLHIDVGGGQEPDGAKTRDLMRWILETEGAYALKGEGEREADAAPIRHSKVELEDGSVVPLLRPNTNAYKDQAAALIRQEQPVAWEECHGSEEPEYGRQMTGQQLIYEETTTGKGRWRWRKKSGRPDHMFDLSAYQVMAAEEAELEALPTLVGALSHNPARRAAAEDAGGDDSPPWVNGDGWWD